MLMLCCIDRVSQLTIQYYFCNKCPIIYLPANREEYLRHSALNYTMQQKKYNNCLTLRMIKLAAQCGYCFDNTDFSFVTVRDRIRCYYKSYVQSMKKRGVIVGYAARKAGLVTKEELEKSAHTSGKIQVPKLELKVHDVNYICFMKVETCMPPKDGMMTSCYCIGVLSAELEKMEGGTLSFVSLAS